MWWARRCGEQVEKYRPRQLSDVAAHKDIIDTSASPSPLLPFSFSHSPTQARPSPTPSQCRVQCSAGPLRPSEPPSSLSTAWVWQGVQYSREALCEHRDVIHLSPATLYGLTAIR
jgi:hypothetical protein